MKLKVQLTNYVTLYLHYFQEEPGTSQSVEPPAQACDDTAAADNTDTQAPATLADVDEINKEPAAVTETEEYGMYPPTAAAQTYQTPAAAAAADVSGGLPTIV